MICNSVRTTSSGLTPIVVHVMRSFFIVLQILYVVLLYPVINHQKLWHYTVSTLISLEFSFCQCKIITFFVYSFLNRNIDFHGLSIATVKFKINFITYVVN